MAVALITGASRGIGAAIAIALAQQGYKVVVNHRASAPQAEDVAATIVAYPKMTFREKTGMISETKPNAGMTST